MPFNGSGVFNRVYSWTQDAANSIDITASRVDTEDTGFATGLTNCVTRDGQGVMGADFLPAAANTYALGSAALPWTQIVTAAFQITKTGATAWGPISAGLVDSTFDTSTFQITYTGFTASITGTATWARAGKQVTLMLPAATGISNNTSFTATGLPSILQPLTLAAQNIALPNYMFLDAATAPIVSCDCLIQSGTGTIIFRKGGSIAGWTGSSTKGVNGPITFSYLIV